MYVHIKKTRMKITQLEEMTFIKVNELNLSYVGLYIYIFHFKSESANVSQSICMAYLANDENFLHYSDILFNYLFLQKFKLANLS